MTLPPFDFEFESVAAQLKPACLKEEVEPAAVDALLSKAEARGLRAEVVHRHGRDRAGAHAEGVRFATVAIARDAEALERVLRLQRAHRPGAQDTPIAEMGEMMGYPSCCAAAFASRDDRGDNLANEKLPFRRAPGAVLSPLLHRLSRVRVVSHHLCAPDCPRSIELATRVLSLAGDASAAILEVLSRPVLFLSYERRFELVGEWQGDRFVFERMSPIAGELPVHGAGALRLDREGVTFEGAPRISAKEPLLTTPGHAIDPSALAAIGGPLGLPPAALELPPQLRQGVRAATLTVTRVERLERVEGAWRLHLQAPSRSLTVVLRAHAEGRPYVIRRGRWAVDVAAPEALAPEEREAVAAIVRALRP
ncbi:MAG: hypothetical protein HYV09_21155 [Deltaproteobacteria bacterium]|nr:hypothetical protein [Deltaproteobacteria bacterium]